MDSTRKINGTTTILCKLFLKENLTIRNRSSLEYFLKKFIQNSEIRSMEDRLSLQYCIRKIANPRISQCLSSSTMYPTPSEHRGKFTQMCRDILDWQGQGNKVTSVGLYTNHQLKAVYSLNITLYCIHGNKVRSVGTGSKSSDSQPDSKVWEAAWCSTDTCVLFISNVR